MDDETPDEAVYIQNAGTAALYVIVAVEDERFVIRAKLSPWDDAQEIPAGQLATYALNEDIASCVSPEGFQFRLENETLFELEAGRIDGVRGPVFKLTAKPN